MSREPRPPGLDDLDRLMSEQGVTPLGQPTPRRRAERDASTPAQATPRGPASPVQGHAMGPVMGPATGPAMGPAWGPTSDPSARRLAIREAELAAARATLSERDAELREARAQLKDLRAQAKAYDAQLIDLTEKLEAKDCALLSQQDRLTTQAQAHKELKVQSSAQARALHAAQAEAQRLTAALGASQREHAELQASSDALLEEVPEAKTFARLLDEVTAVPEEQAAIMRGLAATQLQAILELSVAPADALARLLTERVALTCGAPDCAPEAELVHVRVPPERCEVCEGSNTRRAFQRLLAALPASGLLPGGRPLRLLLVGGSPSYAKQLDALARPHRDRLHLGRIEGKAKPRQMQVRDRVRGADLVVIWGATIMDHATTNAVKAAGRETLDVTDRGIGRMLTRVAEHLSRR